MPLKTPAHKAKHNVHNGDTTKQRLLIVIMSNFKQFNNTRAKLLFNSYVKYSLKTVANSSKMEASNSTASISFTEAVGQSLTVISFTYHSQRYHK
jgi:hypothetical protein